MDPELSAIVPNEGVVIHEENISFVLCKPKLLPMKSVTIDKLERLQREAYTRATQMATKSADL
jgi:BBSome-interacting protein 1